MRPLRPVKGHLETLNLKVLVPSLPSSTPGHQPVVLVAAPHQPTLEHPGPPHRASPSPSGPACSAVDAW